MKNLLLVSCLIASTASSAVIADDHQPDTSADVWGLSVGATSGTTGTNLELSKSVNDYLGMRAEMYMSGSVSENEAIDGNTYKMEFSPKTNGLIFDIKPFGGSFHLSAGFYKQDIAFNLTANTSAQIDLDSTNYAAGEIDSLTGKVSFSNGTAPYVGFGWSNRYKQTSGLGYSLEVGIIDIGTPTTSLTGTCASSAVSCTQANLDASIAAEVTSMNADLDAKGMWPIITFGLNYRF